MTRLEQKLYYEKLIKTLHKTWDLVSKSESDEEKNQISKPSNFKTYTIENRTIAVQNSKQEKPTQVGESCDGPKDAKKVHLANPRKEPRLVFIATNLSAKEEELLLQTL